MYGHNNKPIMIQYDNTTPGMYQPIKIKIIPNVPRIQENTNGSSLFKCLNAIQSMLNQFHRFAKRKQTSSYVNATTSLGFSTLRMICSRGVNLAGGLTVKPPSLLPCFRSLYVAAYQSRSKRKYKNKRLGRIPMKPVPVQKYHL